MIAVGLGVVSDIFLLYAPGVRFESEIQPWLGIDYSFLKLLNPERVQWGAKLGLMVLPFHFFGLLLVHSCLVNVSLSRKIALGYLSALLLIYGIHYHGVMVPAQTILNDDLVVGVNWASGYFKSLERAIGIPFILLSVIVGVEIQAERTLFSKKHMVLLPVVPYAIILGFYIAQVPFLNALAAAGLNLSLAPIYIAAFLKSKA